MTKIDPIIAVKDIQKSATWYQKAFGWKNTHGGKNFAVLVDESENVMLCLHEWETHEHPTMADPSITPGNGLILYFRTDGINLFRANLKKMGYPVEQDTHLNQNSTKKEFSLRDLDGYYLIITEMHEYEG